MANTETNIDMKTLQLLRSAAASASFTDAKAVLNGKLATAADGEIVTASYLKGDEVRTLFAIQRKDVGEGTDKKYGSSFFFDSDKTAEDIQDKINEIIGEGAGTITLKGLNDAIETLNGGETVNGSVSKAVKTEKDRAEAAEDKIEASVGLAADGSFTTPVGKYYINGATSVMNAIEKLDTQAQANANAIANKLNDLDVTDASVDGQFVTAVSQTDGKIAVSRGPVAAENVSLATVSEPEGTENPKSLAATNVQAGIAELFTNILANEKVSADAIAALVNVLGEHTIDGETFEITYTGEGSDIIKNATSFSDADEKLAAAIATLSATKVIDCGTY